MLRACLFKTFKFMSTIPKFSPRFFPNPLVRSPSPLPRSQSFPVFSAKMASGGPAVAKKASAPKKAKALSHPPYIEMVTEALVALKERTGSSSYAIAKHIEEQQKAGLPPNFKKLLSVQLKKFVASGKLVKVKNSFKVAPAMKTSSEEAKPKPKSKPAAKPKAAAAGEAVKKAVATKEKPKKVAPAKAKAKTVAKPKAVSKPVKDKAVKAVAKAKSPAKKVVKKVVEKAKKPKSIKSPVKKAPVAKKAKK